MTWEDQPMYEGRIWLAWASEIAHRLRFAAWTAFKEDPEGYGATREVFFIRVSNGDRLVRDVGQYRKRPGIVATLEWKEFDFLPEQEKLARLIKQELEPFILNVGRVTVISEFDRLSIRLDEAMAPVDRLPTAQ